MQQTCKTPAVEAGASRNFAWRRVPEAHNRADGSHRQSEIAIAAVARQLLGEPNRHLSQGDKLRWGKHGSLAVDTSRNVFYDFESGTGGGSNQLVERVLHCDWRARNDWLASHGFRQPWQPGMQPGPHFHITTSDKTDKTDKTPAVATEPNERALEIWQTARPVEGTLAERYLAQRSFSVWTPDPLPLRFCQRLKWRCGVKPALLVPAHNVQTGELQALQAALLRPDGSKVERENIGSLKGAAFMLSPVGTSRRLMLCEGAEDALLLQQRFGVPMPVWATFGTSGLSGFPVLPSIERLVIMADNDPPSARQPLGAGVAAAQSCERRWRAAAKQVEVYRTTRVKDIGDLLREGAQ